VSKAWNEDTETLRCKLLLCTAAICNIKWLGVTAKIHCNGSPLFGFLYTFYSHQKK